MSSPTPRSGLEERLSRRPPMVTFGWPYLLLGILAALTLPWHAAGGTLFLDVSLCVLAAAWMLGMYTLRPAWRQRAPHMAVFVTGLIAIMAVLVIRDPWFAFLAPVAYVYSAVLLRWPWRLAGVAAVAAVAAIAQTSGVHKSVLFHLAIFLVALALNVLFLCSLTWFLWISDKRLDALAEANRRLEASIAENEGLHRQLLVQAREAGILDERQRMAREIHDTLAQGLAGIVTQLQAAEQAAGNPAEWRRHFAAATRLARENLAEARRSVHALRPEPLETARLSEALADIAGRWSAANGIPVQFTTTGAVRPIRPEVEFALLRAAQEALANVAKHAQASRVGLTVSYMKNEVALDVRDDGVGFDPALLGDRAQASARLNEVSGGNGDGRRPDGDGSGFGLIAMRQRIEAVSGTVHIESEPGGGTAISACVPAVSAQADT